MLTDSRQIPFERSDPRSDLSRAAIALPTDQRQESVSTEDSLKDLVLQECHVATDVDG